MQVEDIDKADYAADSIMPAEQSRLIRLRLLPEMGRDADGNILLGDQPVDVVYVQETLGVGYANIFFNQVKRELKSLKDGDYGIKLGDLLRGEVEVPEMAGADGEKLDDFMSENDQIIELFMKLVEIVPEFLYDVVALSLGVQRSRMNWFKRAITEPRSRGGLSLTEFNDLLITFIHQNLEEMRDFFRDQAPKLVKAFRLVLDQETTAEDVQPANSIGGTPSSTTSPDTQSSPSTTS